MVTLTLENRHLLRDVGFILLESSNCRQNSTNSWQMLLILKGEVEEDQWLETWDNMETRKPREAPRKELLMWQETEKYGVEAIGVGGICITQSLWNQEVKFWHETLIIATKKAVFDHSGTRGPASRGMMVWEAETLIMPVEWVLSCRR